MLCRLPGLFIIIATIASTSVNFTIKNYVLTKKLHLEFDDALSTTNASNP
ncbi:putative ORFan [Tupanvirus deep ocean]|uniref:ORFan n=2 Tax=Tupanvirus TaxID=2094720 RepID=A0AC62A9I1_9VIRU|nr:putative ORFan [Tupanvirus deep ocean]QKU34415.1 putative ORFan [Tupanvirus deep ocean]